MNGIARASGILFQVHLLRTFRTRRALIAALLAAMPVGLAGVVAVVAPLEGGAPRELLLSIFWFFLVQTIVPLVALVMGSAVIAEEIEDRTITYLFTRPIPRSAILFGRWAAVALPMLVLLVGAADLVVRLLSGAGKEALPEGFHGRMLVTVLLGGAVYSAVFAAAGALFKRPILVGLGYTFVFEGFLGNLPGANQKATILFYLRSYLMAGEHEMAGELHEAIFAITPADPAAAVRTLLLVLAGALALGAWRFSKREYVLSA